MSALLLLSIAIGIATAIGLASWLLIYREWRIAPVGVLLLVLTIDGIWTAWSNRLNDETLGLLQGATQEELKALAIAVLAALALLLLGRFISTRAKRNEDLSKTPAQLREMIDALPALVGYVRPDRRYQLINRRMAEYLGRPRGEIVGSSFEEILRPEDAEALRPHVDAALKGQEQRFRARLNFPDRGLRSLEIAYVPDKDRAGRVRGYFILANDISEAERAERALIESEQRFRDLTDIASDWFWETDQSGRYSYISPRMQEVTGMPPSSMLGVRPRDLSGVENTSIVWQELQSAFEGRQSFRNFAYTRRLPDGRLRIFQTSGTPVFGAEGDFQGYRGVCSDITEEVALVERRAQAELRFASAIESVPEAFALYDRNDRLVSRNRIHRAFYEEPFGWEDATGQTFEEIISAFALQGGMEGDDEEVEAWLAARLDRRSAPAQRMRFPTRGGHWLEVTDFLLPDGTVITITGDVTQQERAERERRARDNEVAQVQRRSIMGEMAAMLAHELNQPLSAVVNYAAGGLSRLRERRLSRSEITTALESIGYEAGRASEMLRGIGAFLGNSEIESEIFSVEDLFAAVELLARPEVQAGHVAAEFRVEPELPLLEANRVEIEQVLLNLIRNAIEALQEVPVSQRRLKLTAALAKNDKLAITISDNGKGISAEVGAAAFNAFFTTKSDGLGMGLAISRRIAQGHGGNLRIVTAEPGATTLCLTLPVDRVRHGDDLRAA